MAMKGVMACYWCDRDATTWTDWCVHETPGPFGGSLMAYTPLCPDHAEMIATTQASIAALPVSRSIS